MPRVSLIVAADENDVIGRDNALPWKLSADLKRFRFLTLGKPVIMGRRTWESIGRPLPERHNIVISRQIALAPMGVTVVGDLPAALVAAGDAAEVMVIGGAEIYALAMPLAERIYLTRVHGAVDGDTRLRGLHPAQWRELGRENVAADERNSHATSFIVLERVAALPTPVAR